MHGEKSRRRRTSLICSSGLAAITCLVMLGAQADAQSANTSRPQGERIYVDQGCAVCHGLIGHGGVGPALMGDKFLALGDYVSGQILLGRDQMPGFGDDLSNDQIAAVASYIRNSWGNQFGTISPQDVQQARTKTQEKH